MTAPERVATPASGGGDPSRWYGWRMVGALAVTQTIGYGVLYYAFSVFLTPMQHDLHAGGTEIAAALTIAVLVTALAAPWVGRRLDRHGGRGVMTTGSVLGTLAVLAWSRAETLPQLYAVFVAIGLASAMVLYEPAFAVVVAWFGSRRRDTALLALTIVAGFASSIFLPLTGLLVERYGWRGALVVLALVYGIAAVPLHGLVLRRRVRAHEVPRQVDQAGVVRAARREPSFWLLATAFTANSGVVAVIAVHLVAYLVRLGHAPAFAATVAGLLGVLSVTGRLITSALRRRGPTALITAGVFVLQGVAVVSLPLLGGSVTGAVGCVLLFGLGFGVGTIARPALLADRYGTEVYATLAGNVALPATVAKAAAPLGAAAIATKAGYTPVMIASAVCCLLAGAFLVAYQRGAHKVGGPSN